jgi:DNA-binding NarL/FixJ family response regulator
VIEQEPDLVIIGEAFDDCDLACNVSAGAADVVLLDWELPGLEPAAFIAQIDPPIKVIVLSSHPEARQQALACGAAAFVSKCDAPETVLQAIRRLGPASA